MKHSKSKSSRNKRPAPIRLTVLAGAFDKVPKAEDDYTSWAEVADEIEALALEAERPRKTDLPAISFARLSQPYNIDEHVECLTAIAIDVDRCNLGDVMLAIDALGVAAIVYGSPSDDDTQPDARRVRVCAPVTRPIKVDEIKHVRRAFAESIGIGPGCGVETAEAASQIMFAGRVAGTAAREVHKATGNPVDVDALLAAPLKHEWKRKATPAKRAAAAVDVPADADDPLVPLLWAEYDAGGRREIVRALAGWFAKSGQPEERLLSIIAALPSDQVPARLALARETYAQAREGAVTAGWDALLSRVGSDAAPALETALAGLKWGPWWEAFTARRARLAARAANDTTSWARPVDAPDRTPMILQSRTDAEHVLLWEGPDRGHQPVAMGALRLRVKEVGLAGDRIELEDVKGRPLPASSIVEQNGQTYSEAVYDFAAPVSSYDAPRDRVIVGYPGRHADAGAFDPDVDAWLRALGGDAYPRLEAWIASCAQHHIARLSAALVLLGPADVGKTLFACSVAGLWGVAAPPKAGLLVKQFNGDLTRCPIVFDDEAELFGSKALSTKRFREVVQSGERSIERKGRETFLLRGAMRLIVAGNDVSDLRFTDVTGPDVVQAVADRLCLIDTKPRAAECKAALARLRPSPDSYRIDRDRIVAHMAYLAASVTPKAERFIGAGGNAGGAVLAGHVGEHAEVFESLRSWIDDGRGDTWHAWRGSIAVDTNKLAASLALTGRGWDLTRVRGALAPFKLDECRPREIEGRPRLWALDVERIVAVLGLDGGAGGALRARLAATVPPAQPRTVAGRFGRKRSA